MNNTVFEGNNMGALAMETVGTFFASNVTFTNNYNPYRLEEGGSNAQFSVGGGAIYVATSMLSLASGAAIGSWHIGGNYLFDDCRCVECNDVFAAALLARLCCRFINNTALGAGGAIRIDGVESQYRRCLFQNNWALNGGAISVSSNDIYLHNCAFIGNTAGRAGGAINYDGATNIGQNTGQRFSAFHTLFANNTASWDTPIIDTVTGADDAYPDYGGGAIQLTNNANDLTIYG